MHDWCRRRRRCAWNLRIDPENQYGYTKECIENLLESRRLHGIFLGFDHADDSLLGASNR